MCWVPKCIPKQMRLSFFLKLSALSDGSRRLSGSPFQAIGPATENARRPSMLRRCRGTTRWWRLADRSHWRLATSDVWWQQFTRYRGALPWWHRWTATPSLPKYLHWICTICLTSQSVFNKNLHFSPWIPYDNSMPAKSPALSGWHPQFNLVICSPAQNQLSPTNNEYLPQ